MKILKKLFPCKFSEDKCKDSLLGCKCGKGGSTVIQAPPQAPAPTVGETSAQVYQSKMQYDPQMAQLSYDILTNPNYGLGATTGYLEQQRQELFPGENQVRQALQQQVLQGLQSPTGLTPDQQASIDQRRALATSRMQEASRNNANLGGNLYGGRSQRAEMEDVGNLQNQFAEEDIAREMTARNNSIQAALPFLQILFPDVGLTPPQFESAVPSGGAAYQGLLSARGQDMNYAMNNAQLQQQAQNNRTQLRSSLYQGLGSAAGGWLGGF